MGICSQDSPPLFSKTSTMNRGLSTLPVILSLFLLLSSPGPLVAVSAENGIDTTVTRDGVTFHIRCPNNSSLNKMVLEITAPGTDGKTIRREVDGTVVDVRAGDLDQNGQPEIYIFTSSAGSGSYGNVIAYSVARDGSPQAINLPPLKKEPQSMQGYMGHDTFSLDKTSLIRSFPVYRKGDPNAAPSGGKRQIRYDLVYTDKGYQLRPVRMGRNRPQPPILDIRP